MYIQDCVKRGAALLDQLAPGWWEKVDISGLNLQSPDRYILGYTYGESRDELEALHLGRESSLPREEEELKNAIELSNNTLTTAEAIYYGFQMARDIPRHEVVEWHVAWDHVIRERQESEVLCDQ